MTTTLDQRPALTLAPLDRARPATAGTAPTSRPPATRPTPRPRTAAGWERNSERRDRLHLALSELFGSRGDLEGVSTVADVLAEDLLWSV